jgi:hypothetical protein
VTLTNLSGGYPAGKLARELLPFTEVAFPLILLFTKYLEAVFSDVDQRRLAARLCSYHLSGRCPDTFAAPCIVFASWLEYLQRMARER